MKKYKHIRVEKNKHGFWMIYARDDFYDKRRQIKLYLADVETFNKTVNIEFLYPYRINIVVLAEIYDFMKSLEKKGSIK